MPQEPNKEPKEELYEKIVQHTEHIVGNSESTHETHQREIREREDRADARYNDLMKQPLNLSSTQKLMGIVLTLIMSVVSVTGTYLVFKATTDMRITEVEKKVEKNVALLDHMSQYGFQGHEVRIDKLELKSDAQQQTISDVRSQIAVVVEIVTRVDRKIDLIDPRK
jgi:hypothetical protein